MRFEQNHYSEEVYMFCSKTWTRSSNFHLLILRRFLVKVCYYVFSVLKNNLFISILLENYRDRGKDTQRTFICRWNAQMPTVPGPWTGHAEDRVQGLGTRGQCTWPTISSCSYVPAKWLELKGSALIRNMGCQVTEKA